MSRRFAALFILLALGMPACGPSTTPDDPDCGTEDVQATAEVVIGLEGPSCDPCPADGDLRIATTLTTECGPVEWRLPTTCLVGGVRATRASDGQVFALESRPCGDAFMDWSVTPDEPLVVHEPPVAQVFDTSPIPASTYTIEVEFPVNISIEPTMFQVTIDPP